MDNARSLEPDADAADDYPPAREPRMDPPPAIGTDERRMHVRAYNFWVSLLRGRSLPSVDSFEPSQVRDFGDHGVLLDFRDGADNPAIPFLGAALRAESGLVGSIDRISQVPGRSLLSRLTDHYLQIIANRAPIGFEAEFVNARGNNTLYRGILMPFSSDGTTIDHVYGVINWKELADPSTAMILAIEVGGAVGQAAPARQGRPAPLWADGPGAQLPAPEPTEEQAEPTGAGGTNDEPASQTTPCGEGGLADCLAAARGTVDQLRSADLRTRSALYRALGLAFDFSCAARRHPDDYVEMLADCGIRAQARAPMTAVAKLVFGADYDKTRLTEFAAVLSHGHRLGLPSGGLRRMLEGREGGLKAIVAAERAARRPDAAPPSPAETTRDALRGARACATIEMAAGEGEFVLLIARRDGDGRLAVLAPVPDDVALIDRAIRRLPR
jgi:hypothetical protein